MKYLGVIVTVLAVASGAIAQDMPRCSPKKAEFAEEFIRTKTVGSLGFPGVQNCGNINELCPHVSV
jgi:hypothetical protein